MPLCRTLINPRQKWTTCVYLIFPHLSGINSCSILQFSKIQKFCDPYPKSSSNLPAPSHPPVPSPWPTGFKLHGQSYSWLSVSRDCRYAQFTDSCSSTRYHPCSSIRCNVKAYTSPVCRSHCWHRRMVKQVPNRSYSNTERTSRINGSGKGNAMWRQGPLFIIGPKGSRSWDLD